MPQDDPPSRCAQGASRFHVVGVAEGQELAADQPRSCRPASQADDDYTLQELSEQFEIPKSTMLHHLVILRSAGVVRLKGTPTSVKYTLRDAAVFDHATMLEDYLARPARR